MTDSPRAAVMALAEVTKLLTKLTDDQLEALARGEALIEFRYMADIVTSRPVKKATTPKASTPSINLDDLLVRIREVDEEDAVERLLLDFDKQLTVAALRELAERLGPPVSAKGSNKATLRKNIAAGTAGLRNRPASAFSGAWNA